MNKETYVTIMKLMIVEFSTYFGKGMLFWSNSANIITNIVTKIRQAQ